MAHSKKTIKKIQNLRRSGYSINEIRKILDIPKSTVQRYASSIRLSKSAIERIEKRKRTSTEFAEQEWELARRAARQLVSQILTKEQILIATCLYWAEGDKKDFSIINSDPKLIQVFVSALRRAFKVDDTKIVISLRIYEDLDPEQCKKFWSQITGLQFDKNTHVDVLKGRKTGKLKFGMCRIRVKKGGKLLKLIKSLAEQIVFKLE